MTKVLSGLGMLIVYSSRSGYNPPQFAIDAAKDALDRVECNQYSPTKVDMGGSLWAYRKAGSQYTGPSSPQEGHCRRILAFLRPGFEPRDRGLDYHRSKRR